MNDEIPLLSADEKQMYEATINKLREQLAICSAHIRTHAEGQTFRGHELVDHKFMLLLALATDEAIQATSTEHTDILHSTLVELHHCVRPYICYFYNTGETKGYLLDKIQIVLEKLNRLTWGNDTSSMPWEK